MDHEYLLTLFLTDDNSFYSYLGDKSNDEAINDIMIIKNYLNFLLSLLVRSKEKLETIGCSYEPLSESFKSLIKVTPNGELIQTLGKIITQSQEPIILDRGYLSDFVISLIRISKNNPYNLPKITKYINPKENSYISNILAILKSA